MYDALLNCPFCDAPEDDLEIREPDRNEFNLDSQTAYVHCQSCGADGPPTTWGDDAVRFWNNRGTFIPPLKE